MSPAKLVRIALVGLGFFAAAAVHAQTTLSVSPTIAAPGANVTATWGGIPSPSATDWIGMYTPGAAHTAYVNWRYTTGTASGNVPFTIPSGTTPGIYQLRLFSNNGYTLLATSSNFTVAYTVLGTVTVSSSPLAGVAFTATNGGSCGTSNASGQYTCLVPPNWTGGVTPTLTGYTFSPASRSYTNVTANQTAQDFAATELLQVSGTVTLNSSALAGVVIMATNGVTCGATNASGQYACTVPSGWSGSVTPSLGGYSFTPASRSHSNVTTSQTAQNFTAAADPSSAAILYIHVDHLNTPRLVTNQQDQARWRWDQQEPFGINVPDENPSALGAYEFPLRFPGQYADKETNLHYNYFRDYDSAIGRYVQSDPIGLVGGINTYAYVDSDPLTSDDPEGLQRRGGNPNAPYANQQIANVTANNLISQIRQLQPSFTYTYVTAPGQGGYTPAMIRSLQQTLLQLRQQSTQAPSFVVSSSGVCFPIPQGSGLIPVVNPGGAITGQAFAGGTGGGPGLSPLVTQLRLMNPTPTNPTGYMVYMNSQGQGVSPFTGQVLPNTSPLRHIPR